MSVSQLSFSVRGRLCISSGLVKQTGKIVVNRNTKSLRRISTRPSKLWTSAFAQKERTSLLCQYSEQKKSKIIQSCHVESPLGIRLSRQSSRSSQLDFDSLLAEIPTYATASYPYGQKDCSVKCSHCPQNGILPCKG